MTCPKCREKFQIGDGSATDSSSTLKPKTRGFAWVWIVCLAVLGTLLLVSLLGSLKEYAQQSLNGMFTESFDKATSSSQKGNTPAAP